MSSSFSDEYTHRLRSLMQSVGVSSFKALSEKAGVSEKQILKLRRGQAAQISVQSLSQLSQALNLSLIDLITTFSELSLQQNESQQTHRLEAEIHTLKQEYQRLQTQFEEQQESLRAEFQRSSLQVLESLLIQFPTAAFAVQQNPDVPASRILPLLRPIDQLLKSWGVEAIAPVGSEVPFDPQWHQLMEGTAQPGDSVKIRYTGYRQGEKLLYRARVSPI